MSPVMRGYEPLPGVYDEAVDPSGVPRAGYEPLLDAVAGSDLGAVEAEVARRLRRAGVTFGASDGGLLALDPVPRLLSASEWSTVERGIRQRARALDRFAADVYGERAIVAAGLVPERVIEGSDHFEPAMRHAFEPPVWVSVVGFDLVRGPDGRFRVLEDQVRMPSGIAYAVAARELLDGLLELGGDPAPVGEAFERLGQALAGAAPGAAANPAVVLLSAGPTAAGWYEHARIGRELGVGLVMLADLERRGDEVVRREGDRAERVDVVYLRTDEDRFTDPGGKPTPIGELLLGPCIAGRVACVNAPGSGIADDKLVHAYVEDMVRFYLGEDPVLDSVQTYDLGIDSQREAALEAADELVFKPRGKMGGEGVVVWRDADDSAREAVLSELGRAPERMIAQRRIELSTHPTVIAGALEPRRIDLRPYLVRGPDGDWALPGGLSRVALERGSLIVNSGQGGGVKDTWVGAA
jgi:uncharacterized circularly permuted ATP-grasp superfamily protein